MLTASPTFRALTLAGAFLAFSMNATTGFVFVYAYRYLGFTAADGLHLGVIAAVAGGIGITVSGFLSDYARRVHPIGRLVFVGITATLFTIASLVEFLTTDTAVFYVAFAIATAFARPASDATVPLSVTTPDLVSTSMSLSASASSGMNCEWIFSVIHESLIAFPVFLAASFTSCVVSRACCFAPSCADANDTAAASSTGTASILIRIAFISSSPFEIMAAVQALQWGA